MGTPAAHLGRVRITPYDVVRIVLGLILLTAAGLKGHQLATEPVAETSLFTSRWFLICVVEFELFFGLWLLCGLCSRRTWQAALVCFSAFACVSLYKALSGESTCGCFGRVPVNPWYTLVLDLAAVAALLCWRAVSDPVNSPRPFAGEGWGVRARASLLRLAAQGPGVRVRLGTRLGWVLGIFLAAGIPGALAMGTYHTARLDDCGDIFGASEFVVLEPETWVGKRFPLLKYIDIGDQLAKGEWTVVLYHHACPKCEEVVARHKELLADSTTIPVDRNVALVEVPLFRSGQARQMTDSRPFVCACLDQAREWFVETPAEFVLEQGKVVKYRGATELINRDARETSRQELDRSS